MSAPSGSSCSGSALRPRVHDARAPTASSGDAVVREHERAQRLTQLAGRAARARREPVLREPVRQPVDARCSRSTLLIEQLHPPQRLGRGLRDVVARAHGCLAFYDTSSVLTTGVAASHRLSRSGSSPPGCAAAASGSRSSRSGVVAGAAVLAAVLAGRLVMQDRSLAQATAQLAPGDRQVQVTWSGATNDFVRLEPVRRADDPGADGRPPGRRDALPRGVDPAAASSTCARPTTSGAT